MTGAGAASGADPALLEAYAVGSERLDQELVGVARALARQPVAPPAAAGVEELSWAIATLAEREAGTARWVGGVATALAAADGGRVGATFLDGYVDLGHGARDPGVAARGIEAMVRAGAPVAAIAGAARALGPTGLDGLVRRRPDLVGPVDGMPVTARYAANQRLLSAAIRRQRPGRRRDRLVALARRDERTGRRRQLLLLDERGDGRVVEVIGDLAAADAVAVVVPGAGTDLEGFDRHVGRPAAALQRRAGAAVGGTSTATIAWLGYDPPDGAVPRLGELGAILSDRRARSGGRTLAAAVDGLALRPRQRVTLVGHSYGSTTVAAALLEGARADNVVVLGSPGVLVDHAADFHRPETDFFVLAAHDDPVARLGWFGADPSREGSGFTRLGTDGSGHSSYLRDGSLAQGNVAAALLDDVTQGPLDRRRRGGR